MLTTSYKGICFIAKEEACVLVPYEDGPYLSIGFGHNGPNIKEGDAVTLKEALTLLKADLKEKENIVNTLLKVSVTIYEFDAIVSLAYNKGSVVKQVVKFINEGFYDEAMANLLTYNRDAKGIFRMGLAGRRMREAHIYNNNDYGDLSNVKVYSTNPKVDNTPPVLMPFPTEEEFNQ